MPLGAYGSATTHEVYFGVFEYLVGRLIPSPQLCPLTRLAHVPHLRALGRPTAIQVHLPPRPPTW